MANASSTQDFVPILDINDGVVILKNGQMCAVLLASSINFALKSADEQTAILAQFQAFLNTIDFSLQLYVQSRRLDIEPYLATLATLGGQQHNDLMRVQLNEYMEFVRTFTREVEIMSKNFFVAIPYTPASIDVTKGLKKLMNRKNTEPVSEEEKFQEHRSQLEQRITVVEQGLDRIGVKTIPLGTDELVELYYHIFNPADISSAPKK